jgi:hypothetical protein
VIPTTIPTTVPTQVPVTTAPTKDGATNMPTSTPTSYPTMNLYDYRDFDHYQDYVALKYSVYQSGQAIFFPYYFYKENSVEGEGV